MFLLDILLLLFWIIFFIYWVITAIKVMPDKKASWYASGIGWQIGVILVFILLSQLGPNLPLKAGVFKILAVLFVLVGMLVAVWARDQLGNSWPKDSALEKEQVLVRTGAYRYIRHPIYSGYLLMLLGTIIYFNKYSLVILFFVLSYFLVYKLKQEEELLSREFPSGYKRYIQRTKRLIPFIW